MSCFMNKTVVLITGKSFYPDGHHFLSVFAWVFIEITFYILSQLKESENAYQKTDRAVPGTKPNHLNPDI